MKPVIVFVEFIQSGILDSAIEVATQMDIPYETRQELDLSNCKIAIVHCSPTGWENCINGARACMTVMRVSSVDQHGAFKPVTDTRGVRILNLASAVQDVTQEEWREIFEFLINSAIDEQPIGIIHSLFYRDDAPLLEALLVLCHGYLRAPNPWKFLVEAPSWWMPVFSQYGSHEDIVLQAACEWGEETEAEAFKSVRNLLDAIVKAPEAVAFDVVRRAYLSLAIRLMRGSH